MLRQKCKTGTCWSHFTNFCRLHIVLYFLPLQRSSHDNASLNTSALKVTPIRLHFSPQRASVTTALATSLKIFARWATPTGVSDCFAIIRRVVFDHHGLLYELRTHGQLIVSVMPDCDFPGTCWETGNSKVARLTFSMPRSRKSAYLKRFGIRKSCLPCRPTS